MSEAYVIMAGDKGDKKGGSKAPLTPTDPSSLSKNPGGTTPQVDTGSKMNPMAPKGNK